MRINNVFCCKCNFPISGDDVVWVGPTVAPIIPMCKKCYEQQPAEGEPPDGQAFHTTAQ